MIGMTRNIPRQNTKLQHFKVLVSVFESDKHIPHIQQPLASLIFDGSMMVTKKYETL